MKVILLIFALSSAGFKTGGVALTSTQVEFSSVEQCVASKDSLARVMKGSREITYELYCVVTDKGE